MTIRNERRRWTLLLIAAGFLVLAGAVGMRGSQSSQADAAVERWFLVRIGGEGVGYLRESTTAERRDPDGGDVLLESASEMRIVLNRLGAKVEMALLSGYEETSAGLLKRLSFDLKASVLTMRSEVEVKEGVIEVKTGAAGKPFVRSIPFAGELVGPEGVRMRSLAGLRAPGDAVEYRTFEPSLGKVVRAVRVLLAREALTLEGGAVPALKVEESNDAQAVKRTFWLGEDGEILKDEEPGPFGTIEIVRVDRARALAASSGGELPAEVYERSLIKTGLRLPRPRDLEFLKARLIHRRPELGWPAIPGALQKAVAKTATTLDLEIRGVESVPAVALPLPETAAGREYLEANAYLQSEDPELRALVAAIVGVETDAWRAALKLRRWTADHMTFDLGIAFAPSVEIFKNRRGTCVGYATLLATMARAAGIPSRVVVGYVYALGIFGGHAWTEVLIGRDWIPLDAAVPGAGAADAARFHLAESTLAEGPGAMAGGPEQVMGHIDVKILAYRVRGGRTIQVPDGAEPWVVAGDAYRNPWLGLNIRKPPGFFFGRLDAVWPSTLLVEMKGADGSRIELHEVPADPWEQPEAASREAMAKLGIEGAPRAEKAGGRVAYAISGEAGAAVAIPEPGVVWVIKAAGEAALLRLPDVVKSFVLSR